MIKIYALLACMLLLSCAQTESDKTLAIAKPKSELEQKAGWLLGKNWGKVNEQAKLISRWEKVDDSTFRNFTTMEADILPKNKLADQWLELRKGQIWYITREHGRTFRSKLTSSAKNELVFESQDADNIDKETIQFHGDSISMSHEYEHGVKQRFVFWALSSEEVNAKIKPRKTVSVQEK
ncbi:MAG: hypothetical protein EOO50_14835 [Flavobacterium sp.]|uniref:hypothetical protein n=1 Tax=Flavobacterium sp. TaxID=239 RepID=UPI0012182C6E|nr:hypothetical protein [Flavobacterium sp.]RZJ65184.1 MAG: hypothetical protein EOO50_14835 [Flavobacterium sp.]